MILYMYRLGSIVVDFDIIYESSNVEFREQLVQASVDLASGSNIFYDGTTMAAKAGQS